MLTCLDDRGLDIVYPYHKKREMFMKMLRGKNRILGCHETRGI